MNLEVIKSTPPLECLHCLFVCYLFIKQVSFLYIPTLHNACSHIDNVHRRRRSRAEFGSYTVNVLKFELLFSNDNCVGFLCWNLQSDCLAV